MCISDGFPVKYKEKHDFYVALLDIWNMKKRQKLKDRVLGYQLGGKSDLNSFQGASFYVNCE